MNKLGGFIRLTRPVNCAMMGFAVFVGALLATTQSLQTHWPNILFGFFTGYLLCAAAMTINDYYDRAIDAVNEPTRPIPSGLVSIKESLTFVAGLTIVGLIFAYFSNSTSILCLVVAAAAWIITVTYVTIGKRSGLPGNFLVEYLRSNSLHLRKHCNHRHTPTKCAAFRFDGFPIEYRQRNHKRNC